MTLEFVPLLNHPKYEILNAYPFSIRRADNHKEISIKRHGLYNRVRLNDGDGFKDFQHHRLIALQFIPNDDPEHKNQVDHINRDTSDCHLENLRWVDSRNNLLNRSSNKGIKYKYVDELPDDAFEVNDYGKYSFAFYYFAPSTDLFYFYNGVKYRVLHIMKSLNGCLFVYATNTNNQITSICYNKFKMLYNLI